jgi:hypothetical protein
MTGSLVQLQLQQLQKVVVVLPKVVVLNKSDGELGAKVAAQGDLVRQLKADKKPKDEIDTAVKALLALKVEYKNATGADWQPAGGGGQPKKQDKKKEKKEAPKVED